MKVKQVSLWGPTFTIPEQNTTISKVQAALENPKEVKRVIASKKLSLEDKILLIEKEVNRILGKYKKNTIIIRTESELHEYINTAIQNGDIAIDTETNNTTDIFGDCKLMGLCLYTPSLKNAYIPVNHTNLDETALLENQLTETQIAKQLKRIIDNDVKCIYHNATFDVEVLNETCGIRLPIYWDTIVGAQILNENELKSLKTQYRLHIDPSQEKYDIEHLFDKLPYNIFKPELFALYAATDSFMTYKLYEYQKFIFEQEENKDIYDLFKTVEIPVLDSVIDMESTGVCVDVEYAKKMSVEYHKRSVEIQEQIDNELIALRPIIDSWLLTPDAQYKPPAKNKSGIGKSKAEKLSDPIALDSPTQLAILLYDILKVPVVDVKNPRSTGAEILEELADVKKIKICQLIVQKRKVDILINTFIDAIPTFVKEDGRVHCRFKSTGTKTGRFSSNSPNLQNIPSHDKFIRMIFKASPGCSIIGSDYSGQEPRSLCAFAQETEMQRMYMEGKDLYATIAAKAFHNNYEDNLEFHPETGKLQPDGKKRRSKAKTIQLAITYGMSANTLAERLGSTKEEANDIIDGFYKGFPNIKVFADNSQKMLREKGYVTDLFGRRRHLPDAQLSDYEISLVNAQSDFNPILGCNGLVQQIPADVKQQMQSYLDEIREAKWNKERTAIISRAEADGFKIKNNGGFISRALRQCLNARIQGTAASMTKLAMIMIREDKELNDLGFKLLVTVHDEVFGECPTENSIRCGERLCEVMIEAAKVKCSYTPWKCDPYILKRWYCDEASGEVRKDYLKLIKENSEEKTFSILYNKYPMVQPQFINKMALDTYDCNIYEEI